MNNVFEAQVIKSVRNLDRTRSRVDPAIVGLNLTALVIGFIGVSIGYALNSLGPETMLEIFRRFAM